MAAHGKNPIKLEAGLDGDSDSNIKVPPTVERSAWKFTGAGSDAGSVSAFPRPLVFPEPQELSVSEGRFMLGPQTVIALPAHAPEGDQLLARFLAEELSDRWGYAVGIRQLSVVPPHQSVIILGATTNPLVQSSCAQLAIEPIRDKPSGYVLRVTDRVALVAGADDDGAFYGLQSLRQLIHRDENGLAIRTVQARDWPDKPFRGIRLFLPGPDNVPFFKRFLRDFMALYKFNIVQIEVNACMRLDRHPELNAGWTEFARDANYSRRNYPAGPPHGLEQNASHQDTADGSFLEKTEVADLVAWARRYHIDVIPEIPSLTHSYYLLTKHPELSEVPGERWPDTYCPSNPQSQQLYFEVLDEYLEVMKPKMVHIGHDELYVPINLCPRCRGKDLRELFAEDIIAVHEHLSRRGIRMGMWGDMLLEDVRGKGPQNHVTPDKFHYQTTGALTPEQVQKLPKDILLGNWFWIVDEGKSTDATRAKAREEQLEAFGFKQMYGNMRTSIQEYPERSRRSTIVGGAPSAWEETTEPTFGKDLILNCLGCASLLWSTRVLSESQLARSTQGLMPEIRRRLRDEAPPSETGDRVVSVDISKVFNMPVRESTFNVELSAVDASSGNGKAAIIVGTEGDQKTRLPREVTGICIGEDATSLIFLHASAQPAKNNIGYYLISDMADTADMLGWYEVVYEDGFVATIPIRYGVNLLEWNWRPGERSTTYPSTTYCYAGDPVSLGGKEAPITFFAYEWVNPRLGKVITEVRLKGTVAFQHPLDYGVERWSVIPSNAVMLRALGIVRKRSDADSQRLRRFSPTCS
jgi:hypothetical protein